VIIPGTVDAARRSNAWPLSGALPPMGAMRSVPAIARAHVATMLTGWQLSGLAASSELIVSELATNAVRASTTAGGFPVYVRGRMPLVRVAVLSDGRRALIEVYDQAAGYPVMQEPGPDAEEGRGLLLVQALSSQWGWYPVPDQRFKCVWAELTPDDHPERRPLRKDDP